MFRPQVLCSPLAQIRIGNKDALKEIQLIVANDDHFVLIFGYQIKTKPEVRSKMEKQ